jgi:GT2 family glycosyltransferase
MIELAAPEDPAVSVIVLLDGAVEMAERCLTALAGCEQSVPFETVIVLNAPSPQLEAFARGSTRGGRVLLCRANAGPGVGWNLGAAVARAPKLATLHEDSKPDPGWLPPLVVAMDDHGAGAVGPHLFNLDGSVQNCGWVLFSDGSPRQLIAQDVATAADPTPADTLSGAAMLVDRVAVQAVGGWDERFHPAVFVDLDFCTALWNLGMPVLSVPGSKVLHEGGAFDRRDNSPLSGPRLREFLFLRNQSRFLEKWGGFMSGRETAPDRTRPEAVPAAVAAAYEQTRERAEQVAGGRWQPPRPGAGPELGISGLDDPPVIAGEDGGFRAAPAVEQALDAAEGELIGDYCLWLGRREEEEHDRLAAALEGLDAAQRAVRQWEADFRNLQDAGQRVVRQLEADFRNLQRDREEVAGRLNDILHGRTWRLRSFLLRLLGRS